MKIQKIGQPINFGNIRVNKKDNKDMKYLYNNMLDIINQEKVGGLITNDYIEFSSNKETIIDKLKKLGVNFFKTESVNK